jgi:hypothetical protein
MAASLTSLAISGDLSTNKCEHISNSTECTFPDGNAAAAKCDFCSIDFNQDSAGTSQVCAWCNTSPWPWVITDNYLLHRIKYFALANRASYDAVKLQCKFPNCNSLASVKLILNNSQVNFDFSAFPNGSSVNYKRSFPAFVVVVISLIQGVLNKNIC